MTPESLKTAIEFHHLSQERAATLLGVNVRQVRRWSVGEVPVPKSVALVFTIMAAKGVTVDEAEAMLTHP